MLSEIELKFCPPIKELNIHVWENLTKYLPCYYGRDLKLQHVEYWEIFYLLSIIQRKKLGEWFMIT